MFRVIFVLIALFTSSLHAKPIHEYSGDYYTDDFGFGVYYSITTYEDASSPNEFYVTVNQYAQPLGIPALAGYFGNTNSYNFICSKDSKTCKSDLENSDSNECTKSRKLSFRGNAAVLFSRCFEYPITLEQVIE